MKPITLITLVLFTASQTPAAAPPPRISPERQRQIDEARQLDSKGWELWKEGNHVAAAKAFQDTLKRREKLYPEAHAELADILDTLRNVYQQTNQLRIAEIYGRQCLATYEKLYPSSLYPEGHLAVVNSLIYLAYLHQVQHDFGKAELLFKRAVAMSETLYPVTRYPNGHPELVSNLNYLALLYNSQGEYAQAEPLYRRALAITQKLYPASLYPDGHPDLARSLNNLAGLYHSQGEHGKAEALYRQALAIAEKLYPASLYPDGHPNLARSLYNLAYHHKARGEYDKAEPLYCRVLRIIEKQYSLSRYPHGHPDLVVSLINLATLHQAQRKYEKAEPLYRKALAMTEKLYPVSSSPDGHPLQALILTHSAMMHYDQEEYTKAEPLLRRALMITEKLFPTSRFPEGHPDLATSLNNLATLLQAQGEYGKSEPLYRQALAMYEKLYPVSRYPQGHPHLANSLNNLAGLHQAQGEYGKAEPLFRQALAMYLASAISLATSSDEATALNFVAQQPLTRDAYLSVTRHLSTVDSYPLMWQSKGALSRVIEQRHLAASATQSPKARELWEGMHRLRRERERLLLAPVTADKARIKARDERLNAIDEEIRQLREKLLPLLPQLQQISELAQKTPTDLQRVLPDDAALVDLLRYVRFEQDKKIKGKKGEKRIPSYVAFVVTKQAVVRVELGEAKPIEETLSVWREAIIEGSDAEPKYAVRLYEQLWRPLAKHLPSSIRQLYVSPDAALQRLPWPALRNGKTQRILLEDYRLAVVPHGPFLYDQLSRPAKPIERPRILVMGGVAYDDQPVKPTLLASRDLPGEGVKWNPLPGTKKELEQILTLAGKGRVLKLEGNRASTSALLAELPKANVAHLATHGFFADPKFRTVFQLDPQLFGQLDRERATAGTRSPLILSGIVCAGANRDDTPNRGVVTAEALVALNLDHLNLAVLSACETGLGDVAGGEGVYGLTRALHVCGCRNVAASLWKVNDEATAALMVLFYRQLWDAETPIGPAEAMRQAQLALYRASPEQIQQWSKGRGPSPKPIKSSAIPATKTEGKAATNQAKVWAAFVVSGVGE